MSDDSKYQPTRTRPITSVLDVLRARIDHDSFDAVFFSLDSVAADLGYGDVRPLPGSIAWIDKLREEGKKIAVLSAGERARSALELAGIDDRFDAVITGGRDRDRVNQGLQEIDVAPDRVLAVAVSTGQIRAAQDAGIELSVGLARDGVSAEDLRQAGAAAVLADLQELIHSF